MRTEVEIQSRTNLNGGDLERRRVKKLVDREIWKEKK